MMMTERVPSVDALIGMTVLSRVTGNKLGQVHDCLLDPSSGELRGLGIRTPDGGLRVMEHDEIFSFGKDAVMARGDESVVELEGSPLANMPRARQDITGSRVVTEGGELLGDVANIFVHVAEPPLVVYEVRESILDKLLGRSLFIPASVARALSSDAERIIVPDDTRRHSAESLESLVARWLVPLAGEETVVRDHAPAPDMNPQRMPPRM